MRTCFIIITAAACSAPAAAQPVPSYGIDFVTIGAPGNRPTVPSEVPREPSYQLGAVGYEYRLSRTEITIGQFAEFVTAYQAVRPGLYLSDDGDQVGRVSYLRTSAAGADFNPAHAQYPNEPSWRMAARFCNWLHNGKVNERWAFESGAYDTATFGETGPGAFTDQAVRSPGARFWIPSLDEWVKGVFYDPNRYGPGQEGYWRSTNSTNTVPVSGLPGQGGQTNAGDFVPFGQLMDVGSYPGTQSPWGLLDVSGGTPEWTESYYVFAGTPTRDRIVVGTYYHDSSYFLRESPDRTIFDGFDPDFYGFSGLRLASAVPTPGSLVIGALAAVGLARRSRRGE